MRLSKKWVIYRLMEPSTSLIVLSDKRLLDEIERLAASERSGTSRLVAALAEADKRRLYLALGYSCMFTYCTVALHLSEDAAFNRIEVARASRRFPLLLDLLDEGSLSLTSIRLLAPHLTAGNFDETVRAARHMKKDAVKLLIAKLHPQPPVPSVVRKLPQKATATQAPHAAKPIAADAPTLVLDAGAAPAPTPLVPASPPSHRPIVAPLSAAHYKLQVTISTAAHDRLRRIQDLMRHTIPNGDPALIVERALEMLHTELLKKKAALVARPRTTGKNATAPKGRLVPAAVKRQAWVRDGGTCAFRAEDGKRCGEHGSLEYHHVDPYAHGGKATVANIELRCRAHNGFEWQREVDLGDRPVFSSRRR